MTLNIAEKKNKCCHHLEILQGKEQTGENVIIFQTIYLKILEQQKTGGSGYKIVSLKNHHSESPHSHIP
jgi:hypothetical protein